MVPSESPLAEIVTRRNEALKALGWLNTSNISGLAAKVGYGLFMNIIELPSLNDEDMTVLAQRMIVTIGLGVATTYGAFHIEEIALMKTEGSRVLSSSHW
jgi:hypothetical protein